MKEIKEYLESKLYIMNLSGNKIAIRDKAIENLLDYFRYNLEDIYKITNLNVPGVVEDLAKNNMDILEY